MTFLLPPGIKGLTFIIFILSQMSDRVLNTPLNLVSFHKQFGWSPSSQIYLLSFKILRFKNCLFWLVGWLVSIKLNKIKCSYSETATRGFLWKPALKSFAKFTGKHLCRSLLFSKIAGWRLRHRCLCEFCEVFKNTFFTDTCGRVINP